MMRLKTNKENNIDPKPINIFDFDRMVHLGVYYTNIHYMF